MLIYHFNLQMHNKALVKHYTGYVNNFAFAMHTLAWVRGYMHTLEQSSIETTLCPVLEGEVHKQQNNLSLQGLLLKPIQRFPQYILFLTVYFSMEWRVGEGC